MYQTCACVIHINLHTLSAACALVTLMFARGMCASTREALVHWGIYLAQSIVHEHCSAGPGCIREVACITLSVAKHWSGGLIIQVKDMAA